MLLLYATDDLNITPQPFIHQLLYVFTSLICQPAHELVNIRFEVNWQIEFEVWAVELASFSL